MRRWFRKESATPEDEITPLEIAEDGPVKPFIEHLEDLRGALFKILGALFVGFNIALLSANHILAFLTRPLRPGHGSSRELSPEPECDRLVCAVDENCPVRRVDHCGAGDLLFSRTIHFPGASAKGETIVVAGLRVGNAAVSRGVRHLFFSDDPADAMGIHPGEPLVGNRTAVDHRKLH